MALFAMNTRLFLEQDYKISNILQFYYHVEHLQFSYKVFFSNTKYFPVSKMSGVSLTKSIVTVSWLKFGMNQEMSVKRELTLFRG